MTITDAINRLVAGHDLDQEMATAAMGQIMAGDATPAQFGAFVTALRMKGETVPEIAGMVQAMRQAALRILPGGTGPLLDTCGTGGDGSHSLNVSTAAAFVAAAAGIRVAKHGNRAASSQTGTADVLEAVGCHIGLTPDQAATCLEEAGIVFLWAQVFHPAMKYAAAPRREIGIRTVFNILGPLSNPAGATHQVLGVAEENLTLPMAQVLQALGTQHALVVHGTDGLDELSLGAPSVIAEVRAGVPDISLTRIDPASLGLAPAGKDAIRGGDPAYNAQRLRAVLQGETGAYRDIVLLNSAAALLAADTVPDLATGLERAAQLIDSGAANAALDRLIEVSNRLGKAA